MQLQNKVALVTGAGHGIGRGIAWEMAREGALVAVNYRQDQAGAAEVVREITRAGGDAVPVHADVSNREQRDAMFEQILDRFGRLDILVNNAAWDPGVTDPLKLDESLYDGVLAVNLKGAFFCAQAAARAMIRQGDGGRIINISSVHGKLSLPRHAPYSLTKGGLDVMTRQLAIDLASHRITVNAVAPGFIEVRRTIDAEQVYDREKIGALIPIGRVGFPEDVAWLTCFLASEKAAFLTGQVILIDGGTSARMAL